MKNPIVVENEKRVKRMNELYELDNRGTDPNHPHKNTFTGLGVEIATYRKFAEDMAIYKKWNDKNYPLS
tara:strand:- start:297 stop:503 length:207 start_codon:yes stop_codon:yes gene_type:complete